MTVDEVAELTNEVRDRYKQTFGINEKNQFDWEAHSKRDYSKANIDDIFDRARVKFSPVPVAKPIATLADDAVDGIKGAGKALLGPAEAVGGAALAGLEALRRRKNMLAQQSVERTAESIVAEAMASNPPPIPQKGPVSRALGAAGKVVGGVSDWVVNWDENLGKAIEKAAKKIPEKTVAGRVAGSAAASVGANLQSLGKVGVGRGLALTEFYGYPSIDRVDGEWTVNWEPGIAQEQWDAYVTDKGRPRFEKMHEASRLQKTDTYNVQQPIEYLSDVWGVSGKGRSGTKFATSEARGRLYESPNPDQINRKTALSELGGIYDTMLSLPFEEWMASEKPQRRSGYSLSDAQKGPSYMLARAMFNPSEDEARIVGPIVRGASENVLVPAYEGYSSYSRSLRKNSEKTAAAIFDFFRNGNTSKQKLIPAMTGSPVTTQLLQSQNVNPELESILREGFEK